MDKEVATVTLTDHTNLDDVTNNITFEVPTIDHGIDNPIVNQDGNTPTFLAESENTDNVENNIVAPELKGSTIRETFEEWIDGEHSNNNENSTNNSETEDEAYEHIDYIDANSINSMLSSSRDMIKVLADLWMNTAQQYKMTGEYIQKLFNFNNDNITLLEENPTDEEKENFDKLNGLNHLTEDDIKEIFPSDHPCVKPELTDSIDTIKNVLETYIAYASSRKEYEMIHRSYMEYMNKDEEQKIEEFKKKAEEETDPEKKASLESQIEHYYYLKNLDFLAEPISELYKQRIQTGLRDSKKVVYWIGRTEDKLKQLKVDPRFTMMLYHFEERFLEEKYHHLNNCLLLQFCNFTIYAKMSYVTDEQRNMCRCFVIAISSLFNNMLTDEERDKVLNNIRKFEDQLIGVIVPNTEYETIKP